MLKREWVAAAMLGVCAATPAAAGPTIILNNIGGAEEGTQARAGFERAAALWAAALGDDVVLRLDVSFRSLGSGVLGSTSSARADVEYGAVRSALYGDRTSELDRSAYASLGSRLSFYSNEAGNCATGAGCQPIDADVRAWDRDGTRDNLFIGVNKAVQKALGLRDDDGFRDADIAFSPSYRWDFDRSDGITRGYYDFVGVAAHEIGHALGFVSGVDRADAYMGYSGLDTMAWGTVLDLFRYQDGRRDWTVGGEPCISADRGATCIGLTATGTRSGDGRQASHWKDNRGIGIMDPSATAGAIMDLTGLDLDAFDLIGWDLADVLQMAGASWSDGFARVSWGSNLAWSGDAIVGHELASEWLAAVPGPGALALFGLGVLGLGLRRRTA